MATGLLLPENAVSIIQGSSKTLELTVSDADGNPVDLTGATVIFTVKERVDDPLPLIQKSSNILTEVDIIQPTAGKARIYLLPMDTQNRSVKKYKFDVWVILSSGLRYPVIKPSIFEVESGVTRLLT